MTAHTPAVIGQENDVPLPDEYPVLPDPDSATILPFPNAHISGLILPYVDNQTDENAERCLFELTEPTVITLSASAGAMSVLCVE